MNTDADTDLHAAFVANGHRVHDADAATRIDFFTSTGTRLGTLVRTSAGDRWIEADHDETSPDAVLYADPTEYEATLRAAR